MERIDQQLGSTVRDPHVLRALRFIKSKGSVTPEQLVEWDSRNGRHLFTWDDAEAGEQWRVHEARLFFNRFRAKFDGMRIRAFINLPDPDSTEKSRSYYPIQAITENLDMRQAVIHDLTRRITSLTSELRLWNLSASERQSIITSLESILNEGRGQTSVALNS